MDTLRWRERCPAYEGGGRARAEATQVGRRPSRVHAMHAAGRAAQQAVVSQKHRWMPQKDRCCSTAGGGAGRRALATCGRRSAAKMAASRRAAVSLRASSGAPTWRTLHSWNSCRRCAGRCQQRQGQRFDLRRRPAKHSGGLGSTRQRQVAYLENLAAAEGRHGPPLLAQPLKQGDEGVAAGRLLDEERRGVGARCRRIARLADGHLQRPGRALDDGV